jgi:hypothetical protein
MKQQQSKCFWSTIINHKSADGHALYPLITKVIRYVLSFGFGTAEVERDFSLLSIIKTKLRNRLKIETVDALMRVRENIPNDLNLFEPGEKMFALFNSQMYNKKITTENETTNDDTIEFDHNNIFENDQ